MGRHCTSEAKQDISSFPFHDALQNKEQALALLCPMMAQGAARLSDPKGAATLTAGMFSSPAWELHGKSMWLPALAAISAQLPALTDVQPLREEVTGEKEQKCSQPSGLLGVSEEELEGGAFRLYFLRSKVSCAAPSSS